MSKTGVFDMTSLNVQSPTSLAYGANTTTSTANKQMSKPLSVKPKSQMRRVLYNSKSPLAGAFASTSNLLIASRTAVLDVI
jgi:hypothetical protein